LTTLFILLYNASIRAKAGGTTILSKPSFVAEAGLLGIELCKRRAIAQGRQRMKGARNKSVSEGDDRRALVAELTAENLTLESGACFKIAPALFRKERLHSAL